MRVYEGTIKSWIDEKGFGFIEPDEGGKDVFIHIRDLKNKDYRPNTGETVVYKIFTDENGKTRATHVFIKGMQSNQNLKERVLKNNSTKNRELGLLPRLLIAIIPFILSAWLIKKNHNFLPFFFYFISSLLTFVFYAYDKVMAHKGRWRVSESTLHSLEFWGGWPAALVAQYIMRHKNRKQSFKSVFWMIVFVHLIVWVAILFFDFNIPAFKLN